MKRIPLTKGKFALVDKKDYDYLNQWKWFYHSNGYAARWTGGRKNAQQIFMHRLILNTPQNKITDHIDHNKLNNCRSNLRIVNKAQNGWNAKLKKNNKTGYSGVYKDTHARIKNEHWYSKIMVKGEVIYLGYFNTIQEAITARKVAEIKYFGEYRYDC